MKAPIISVRSLVTALDPWATAHRIIQIVTLRNHNNSLCCMLFVFFQLMWKQRSPLPCLNWRSHRESLPSCSKQALEVTGIKASFLSLFQEIRLTSLKDVLERGVADGRLEKRHLAVLDDFEFRWFRKRRWKCQRSWSKTDNQVIPYTKKSTRILFLTFIEMQKFSVKTKTSLSSLMTLFESLLVLRSQC